MQTNWQLITYYFCYTREKMETMSYDICYLVRLLITFLTFFALFFFTVFFCTFPHRLFCFLWVLAAFVHTDLLRGSRRDFFALLVLVPEARFSKARTPSSLLCSSSSTSSSGFIQEWREALWHTGDLLPCEPTSDDTSQLPVDETSLSQYISPKS